MMWVIVTMILTVVTVTAFFVLRHMAKPGRNTTPFESRLLRPFVAWAALGVGVAIILIYTLISSLVVVDTGQIGILRTFGTVDGTLYAGVNLIAPWQDVVPMDIRVKAILFNSRDQGNGFSNTIDAFSQETQNVFINATVNYQVAPKDAPYLFRTVGPNYYNILIPSRVNQVFKDVTVKYPAVQIAPNREAIRIAVRTRLQQELARFSITIVDVNINDISFSPQFQAAIEAKQETTQQVLRAQQLVKRAQFDAQAVVAQAQGDAQSTIVRAQGQATANADLSKSLTPTVLQYLTIQRLASKIQVIMVPSNGSLLVNPSQFIKP
jgi:regulator of protease activity HflC (stomatin/prohibitin superfamily)